MCHGWPCQRRQERETCDGQTHIEVNDEEERAQWLRRRDAHPAEKETERRASAERDVLDIWFDGDVNRVIGSGLHEAGVPLSAGMRLRLLLLNGWRMELWAGIDDRDSAERNDRDHKEERQRAYRLLAQEIAVEAAMRARSQVAGAIMSPPDRSRAENKNHTSFSVRIAANLGKAIFRPDTTATTIPPVTSILPARIAAAGAAPAPSATTP